MRRLLAFRNAAVILGTCSVVLLVVGFLLRLAASDSRSSYEPLEIGAVVVLGLGTVALVVALGALVAFVLVGRSMPKRPLNPDAGLNVPPPPELRPPQPRAPAASPAIIARPAPPVAEPTSPAEAPPASDAAVEAAVVQPPVAQPAIVAAVATPDESPPAPAPAAVVSAPPIVPPPAVATPTPVPVMAAPVIPPPDMVPMPERPHPAGPALPVAALRPPRFVHVPALLLAGAVLLHLGAEIAQSVAERGELRRQLAAQETLLVEAANVRRQVTSLVSGTGALANAGNGAARAIVEEMRRQGMLPLPPPPSP